MQSRRSGATLIAVAVLLFAAAAHALTPETFEAEIAKRIQKVEELAFLRAEAKRLGIREGSWSATRTFRGKSPRGR